MANLPRGISIKWWLGFKTCLNWKKTSLKNGIKLKLESKSAEKLLEQFFYPKNWWFKNTLWQNIPFDFSFFISMKNADLAPCKFHGVMHDNKMDILWMIPCHEHCWCVHKQVKGTRFVFSVLWGRWVADHPQENLAKFGYKLERTLEILRISNMIWLCIGTDCLNMVISFFFFSQNIEALGHLFPKKCFVGFALLCSFGKWQNFAKN